jgi:beta-galactosidase
MENYVDRMRGSDVGLYTSSVREQLTPYAKPMEAGNHQDVRWGALTGDKMPGLMAQSGASLLQISALPYTDEEMDIRDYSVDLPQSNKTVLVLSAKNAGRRLQQLRSAAARSVHRLVRSHGILLRVADSS